MKIYSESIRISSNVRPGQVCNFKHKTMEFIENKKRPQIGKSIYNNEETAKETNTCRSH